MDMAGTGGLNDACLAVYRAALKLRSLQKLCYTLFQLAVSYGRRQGQEDLFVSHSGLRNLLDDLSQVPAVVQESHIFGPVEPAIQSCFTGVINDKAGEEHFVNWLRSEPRLLLWLSTLYRLSVSEDVQHRVRCHACKAFPITGISAHASGLQQQECVKNLEGLDATVSENVLPSPPSSPPTPSHPHHSMESKSLQTDELDTQPQRKMSLLQKDLNITQKAMKDLQRDKGVLENEFQVWKVAAQSEHDSLEGRCTELKTTMEALIQHNQQLEEELGQVRHALSMRGREESGSDIHTPSPQQSRHDTSEKQGTETESSASVTTEKDPEVATGEVSEREHQMDEKQNLNEVQEEEHKDVVLTETSATETEIETEKKFKVVWESDEDVKEEEEEEDVDEKSEEDEPQHYRVTGNSTTLDRSFVVEDSGTDNSDEEADKEEELNDLVQRLHDALLSTPTGKCKG
ncbi:dystrotelin [Silurus meridionalis]|nr:dystrotelin [Silurus meridionalis]